MDFEIGIGPVNRRGVIVLNVIGTVFIVLICVFLAFIFLYDFHAAEHEALRTKVKVGEVIVEKGCRHTLDGRQTLWIVRDQSGQHFQLEVSEHLPDFVTRTELSTNKFYRGSNSHLTVGNRDARSPTARTHYEVC